MTLRFAIGFTLVVVLVGIAAKSAITRIATKDIGKTTLIIGELGKPLGETITIHGFMSPDLHADEFTVETVNGKTQPDFIRVPGTESWPAKTAATLRGAEIAVIRLTKRSETNAGFDEPFKPRQKAFRTFRVDEIIAPAGLKLDPSKETSE